MRVLTAGVVLALLCTPALAGCGGDDDPEAEPVVASALPENLCSAVPQSVVSRWSLAEDDHALDETEGRHEATCSMSGEAQGAPVTLQVSLTSFGAADKDAVRTMMDADLGSACDALEAGVTSGFTDEDGRCSTETPARPASERGQVTEYSLSIPAHGLVTVVMRHSGDLWQAVGADVVAVSGTLSTTDPAKLS